MQLLLEAAPCLLAERAALVVGEINDETPYTFGDTFIPIGGPPAKKGEPGTGVSEPSAPMLKDVMVSDHGLPAIKNRPSGVAAMAIPITNVKALQRLPELASGKGEPGTGVRVPLLGSMEKALTSLLPVLDA